MTRIYIAHQISGLTPEEVFKWFDSTKKALQSYGYTVYSPMTGKEEMRTELRFREEGYENNPVASNHAIYERDKYMVCRSDIVLTDFTGTELASIGCSMELAWASLLGKHTVIVLPKSNVHRHAFILESADIIFEDLDSALNYLHKIGGYNDR